MGKGRPLKPMVAARSEMAEVLAKISEATMKQQVANKKGDGEMPEVFLEETP